MSAGAIEGDQGPEFDEVLQLEHTAYPAVRVCVDETVSVQPAQSAGGSLAGRNVLLAATAATKLLNADATRGETTLIGGAAFWLGYNRAECEAHIAQIPALVPITIRNGEAVWVMAATADTYVTAISDQWTK
jgi:hypothetical protein